VDLAGPLGNTQLSRNLLVGHALGEHRENFVLPATQPQSLKIKIHDRRNRGLADVVIGQPSGHVNTSRQEILDGRQQLLIRQQLGHKPMEAG
jgi:hypothetical protein